MRVYVCIKQVPDTETKLKIKATGDGIETTGIKWVMNPYDEYAVEEAVKWRETGKAESVTVFGLGPKARVVDALRTALAMGADEAVVVDAPETFDSSATAAALAAAIKGEGPFGVVLTGKLAIDDNAAAVGQILAENLGIPHVTVVSKAELAAEEITVERETDGGTREIVQIKLPALVAVNKGLNTPRYASLPGIMKAKKKTIKELSAEALGVSTGQVLFAYTGFQLPAEKPAVTLIEGDSQQQSRELVRKLRDEAKVL